jgi:hypothetical protein
MSQERRVRDAADYRALCRLTISLRQAQARHSQPTSAEKAMIKNQQREQRDGHGRALCRRPPAEKPPTTAARKVTNSAGRPPADCSSTCRTKPAAGMSRVDPAVTARPTRRVTI